MPTVEKTSAGRVSVRDIGEFVQGEQADVSEADARYLCEERGDFTIVDEPDPESEVAVDAGDADGITVEDVETIADDVIADRINDGVCPWCDDYEGDAVGQHASSAHPEKWTAYKED